LVRDDARVVARVTVENGDASVSETLHAVQFGVLSPAATLQVTLHQGSALTRWAW
jgi:hypothetical protein